MKEKKNENCKEKGKQQKLSNYNACFCFASLFIFFSLQKKYKKRFHLAEKSAAADYLCFHLDLHPSIQAEITLNYKDLREATPTEVSCVPLYDSQGKWMLVYNLMILSPKSNNLSSSVCHLLTDFVCPIYLPCWKLNILN